MSSKPTSQILREARKLISVPERWCQHKGHDGEGRCSVLAMHDAAGNMDGFNVVRGIFRTASAIGPDIPISNWNDAPERTHPEVLAAFDAAIALAEKEEGKKT